MKNEFYSFFLEFILENLALNQISLPQQWTWIGTAQSQLIPISTNSPNELDPMSIPTIISIGDYLS